MHRLTLFLILVLFLCVLASLVLLPSLPRLTFGLFEQHTAPVVTHSGSGDRIVFLGDIMLGRNVERLMERNGGTYPWERLRFTEARSIVVGNFEATVPEIHFPTPDFGFQFSVATTALPAMVDAGLTHVSLANNHSYDFGPSGYAQTLAALHDAGVAVWGDQKVEASSSVTYVNLAGQTVALIALVALEDTITDETLDSLFSEISPVDQSIVYVHWGIEYEPQPSAKQRALAQALAARDVDLIVGHHPHVVQPFELINNTLVVYSLGNFIFDQYFTVSVMEGLTLTLHFEGGLRRLTLEPITTADRLSSPRLMHDQEKAVFLADLASRSGAQLSTAVQSGEIVW